MNDKCFCHLNGYAVKDATARKQIIELSQRLDNFDNNSEEIANLETRATDLETQVEIHRESIENVDTRVDGLEAQAETTRGDIENLDIKLSDLESLIPDNVNEFNNKIAQLYNTIAQQNTLIAQQNNQIAQQNNQIADIESVVNSQNTKIANLESAVNNHTTEIGVLKAKVQTLETDVNNLETTVSYQNKRIGTLETKVTNLTSEVAILRTRVDTHDSTLANHESRIRKLEEEDGNTPDTVYPYSLYSTFKNETNYAIAVGGTTISAGSSKSLAVATVHSANSTTPIYLNVEYGFVGGNVLNTNGTVVYYFESEEYKSECYFAPNEVFRFTEEQDKPTEPDTPDSQYPYYKYAMFVNDHPDDTWTIGGKDIASVGGAETIAIARVNSATSETPIYLDVEAGFEGGVIKNSKGEVVYTFTSEEVKSECLFTDEYGYTIEDDGAPD